MRVHVSIAALNYSVGKIYWRIEYISVPTPALIYSAISKIMKHVIIITDKHIIIITDKYIIIVFVFPCSTAKIYRSYTCIRIPISRIRLIPQ